MVGIICAEPQELEAIKKYMKNTIVEEKYDLKCFILLLF